MIIVKEVSDMKKIYEIALITACIGGLVIGCSNDSGSRESEASDAQTEAASSIVSETAPAESSLSDAESMSSVTSLYDGILDTISECHSGQADDETMSSMAELVSPDLMYVPSEDPIYYTLIDVDGNGVDELLIYQHMVNEDGEECAVIYDGYTVRDGELVHFIAGGARNSYYLCSDGSFYNRGSNGAAYACLANYTYDNGELTLTKSYFSDDDTGEIAWYMSTTGIWTDDRTEVTEEEALEFFDFEYMFIPNELEV